MSAYSRGLEISRRSDAINVGWYNDLKIWWITMGNSNNVHGFSYSNATAISVNW